MNHETAPTVSADRRLGPYTVLAVAGLIAALLSGQAAFAAMAAPAGMMVVAALADRRPIVVKVVSIDAPDRCLEGDAWDLGLRLVWNGPAVLDVLHVGLAGHIVEGVRGWRIEADGGADVTMSVVAQRWGRHDLGALVLRARRPDGMIVFDQRIDLGVTVRVLPSARRLDRLLEPRRPRVAAGAHAAIVRGPGTDLAELRPYAPGDRLRDLSWSASARSDQPWVVVRHPERTGTVVLLLDGFIEVGAPPGSLDRAARVVWSVARHHLDAGDRVGLLAAGAAPAWLPPTAGRRARWQVLDTLLTIGSAVSGKSPSAGGRPRHVVRDVGVPADAFIVGVSPLQSDAFVSAVVHHVRLGRPTVVIGVETADLLAPPADETERAARRLWQLDAEVRRATLSRAGVASVVVVDDAAPAISLLGHRRRRSVGRVAS